MKEKNIEILNDTLACCEAGYYEYQGSRIDFKLTPEKMKDCEVLLPDEVHEICRTVGLPEWTVDGDNEMQYSCANMDTFTFVQNQYRDSELISGEVEKGVLVLNLANPVNIGGGVRRGSKAQEEDLCRRSTLLQSLESKMASRYYEYNRGLDTFMGSDAMILSPAVEVFKDEEGLPLEETFVVSVLTCAAPSLRKGTEDLSQEEYEEMMYRRISAILKCAANWGYRYLVLGAFGCGAFHNDAGLVSDLFAEAIEKFAFNRMDAWTWFRRVDFAVLGKGRGKYNYDEFCRNFGADRSE